MSLFYGIGSILMLHRVQYEHSGDFAPNKEMAVSPEFLENFVQNVKQRGYTFVSLDFLVDQLAVGAGQKLLAMTFDDGYRDNFTEAYPILKRLGIPFAIYVTTSFPDGEAVLWWYALEQLLQEHDQVTLADGRVLLCRTSQEKLYAFASLRKLIMTMPRDRLGESINEMFGQVHFDWRQMCVSQALSWDDIHELARDPLVTIGAHTVSHPVLSSLSTEQVCAEMLLSRERIEDCICAPVAHFCYPFGSRNEVGAREFELAKTMGYKSATTTRWGNIFSKHRESLHALPRVPLTNSFSWDGFRKQSLRRFWRGRVVSA